MRIYIYRQGDIVLAPQSLAESLSGILSFPATPFTRDGELDTDAFVTHLQRAAESKPSAIFICAGAGEFGSLTLAEYRELVQAATTLLAGSVTVLAGVGGGTRVAAEYVRLAETSGADGVLVFPPYLSVGPSEGLFRHYQALAAATSLGLVLYQRDSAVLTPDVAARLAAVENVIALKDGHGDVDLMQQIKSATDGELLLINGMPTAEMYALPYAAFGARAYSSATLEFAPEIALAFHRAYEQDDTPSAQLLLREFFAPLAQLSRTTPGYPVALVKAGLRIRGRSVGPVRPPLVDMHPHHEQAFSELIDHGLSLCQRMSGS